MYSPTIFASIVTTINIPYFSASSITLFLSFLKTDNVSGYIIPPVMNEALYDNNFSVRPPSSVLRHTLQHILHSTQPSPSYAQTSFRNSLTQNDVPPSVQSKRKSYVLVLYFLHYEFLNYLSLMSNPTFPNNILHITSWYTYMRNYKYIYIFVPKGLTQISKSTLTHISLYRPFIPNSL